ncbi:MAG: asparaginase [Cytophagales bacterium]|nr:asparaginase [Cytophagales bacterium]
MTYKKHKIEGIGQARSGVSSILIIYTGGTLGMVFDQTLKTLIPLPFREIAQYVPELKRVEANLTIIPIEPPIDSSDMSPEIWIQLASIIESHYQEFDGFVILHGTDTMAYTASALSFLLENLSKPVVFTGAQLSLGVARTDARENMITAIELAADKKEGVSVLSEVCIYFNGKLLRGNRSKKHESSQFDAFQSENYPHLAEVGVYCEYNLPYLMKRSKANLVVHKRLNPNVLIVRLFPGMAVNALDYFLGSPDLEAVIIETYGSGNASSNEAFLRVLKNAVDSGIHILNISQCEGGSVRQQDYATGLGLKNIGVISGGDMTAEAAVTKLMFLLAQGLSPKEVKEKLEENLRGELTI